MDFTQYVLLAAVIAGAVELITRIRARDWWVVVTICVSAVIGWVFGLSGYYPDLDPVEGLVAGIGTSGAIAAIGVNRSKATPSDPVQK